MRPQTWAEVDADDRDREAKRAAKVRDLTDRLAKVLAKEFSVEELARLKSNALGMNAIQIEAWEIARQNTKRR